MIYFFKWKFTAHERHRFNSSSGQSLHLTDLLIGILCPSIMQAHCPTYLFFFPPNMHRLFLVTEDMTLHKSFSYLVISLSHC